MEEKFVSKSICKTFLRKRININIIKTVCITLVELITIVFCILPMSKLPLWNGEIPEHRNQYELITEAILEGRVDFAYGDEDELAKLDNPYDYKERTESGVPYHWDHAFYDGHYYMYFGIVPVFLAFLPYRIITGTPLTTFHATQFFVAVTILGIFFLFRLLSKCFLKELPLKIYLLLSVAFSIMSVWYSIAEPALYCTAITAAISLEVWSLYFYTRAVYWEKEEKRQIIYAGIGALLGALVFGCRPPIALANIVVLPLLAVFLRERTFTWKLARKLLLAATPYVVIAICLMGYNYARFDNPFEFGQAYQLTVTDQSNYSIALGASEIVSIIRQTGGNFIKYNKMTEEFPYLQASGVFLNFPILLFSVVVIYPPIWKKVKELKIMPFLSGLLISVFIITIADVIWSPYLMERYRMDIYFLMGIACFLIIGLWYDRCKYKRLMNAFITFGTIITVVSAFLLYVRTLETYYPEKVTEIANWMGIL